MSEVLVPDRRPRVTGTGVSLRARFLRTALAPVLAGLGVLASAAPGLAAARGRRSRRQRLARAYRGCEPAGRHD